MAAVTHAGTTWNTTAGNKTVTATPAVDDLIIVIAATSGLSGGTTSVTDNNSSGTYTQVDQDRTGFSTTGVLTVWVRNSLIAAASSTIFTANQGSSTGGGLTVLRVSGMSRTGSSAVRSNGGESSGTSGTAPAPVLNNTPLTGNPVVGAVCCGTNSTTNFTPRSSPAYSEDTDSGYNTPATGLEVMHIASGETSATITWGSNAPSTFASVAVELDTSAAPAISESSWDGTGTPITTTQAGAADGDLIVVMAGGDAGTGSDTISAVTTTTGSGSTGSWTEAAEFIPAGSAGWFHAASADVTATGSVQTSTARTQAGTPRRWGVFSLLVVGGGTIGNVVEQESGSAESISLTVQQGSTVLYLAIDWDAATPATGFTPSGAFEVERASHTDVTVHAAIWENQPAQTVNYGTNGSSSSTNIRAVVVEVRPPAAVVERNQRGIRAPRRQPLHRASVI